MSPSNTPDVALLVTGTDMGVGKTYVAAGLAHLLRDEGIDVGVMKPIELGWSRGLDVVGVVANRLDRSIHDPSTPTNAKMIERADRHHRRAAP